MGATRWMRRFDFDPEAVVRLSWTGGAGGEPAGAGALPFARPKAASRTSAISATTRCSPGCTRGSRSERCAGFPSCSGGDGARRGRHRLRQRHRPEAGRRDLAKQDRQGFEHDGRAPVVPHARDVAVVQQQDVAGGEAAAKATRDGAPGSRLTVSKPRRVQATWARPMPARTGSSSGLRRPTGGRKKRGASPLASAIARCPAATSRRIAPKGRAAKALRWRSVWFSALWPRRTSSRASAGCRAARRPIRKKEARRAVRLQQLQDARGDLRVRPVVEGKRDLASAARLLRQAEEVGAEQAVARKQAGDPERGVVGEDGADRPGPNRRVRSEAQSGAGVQPAGRAHHRCGRPVAARRARWGLEHPEAAAASVSRARSCGRRGRPVHAHAAGRRRAGGGRQPHAARAQTTRSRP